MCTRDVPDALMFGSPTIVGVEEGIPAGTGSVQE